MTIEKLHKEIEKIIEPLGYRVLEVDLTVSGGNRSTLPTIVTRYSNMGLGSAEVDLTVEAKGVDSLYPDIITQCHLVGVPGCCGMAVITGLHVHHRLRRNGLGALALTFMEELASMLNYGGVIGTDISSSLGIALLNSLPDWTPHPITFENPRTSNSILTYIKEL